jgi:hypothetical protein
MMQSIRFNLLKAYEYSTSSHTLNSSICNKYFNLLQHCFANLSPCNFNQWRTKMYEQQCDDFFIPSFLLKQPLQQESAKCDTPLDDFLKGIQGWAEYFWVDECVE